MDPKNVDALHNKGLILDIIDKSSSPIGVDTGVSVGMEKSSPQQSKKIKMFLPIVAIIAVAGVFVYMYSNGMLLPTSHISSPEDVISHISSPEDVIRNISNTINQPPIVNNQTVSVNENKPLDIMLTALILECK